MAISDLEYEIGLNIGKILESDEFESIQKKDLAVKLGIPASNFSDKLIGKRRFHVDELCKLADALGVSTDYLLGRPDSIKSPDPNMQTAVAVTGLSERAIENIVGLSYINHFLESDYCHDFFYHYSEVLQAVAALQNLLDDPDADVEKINDAFSYLRLVIFESYEGAILAVKESIHFEALMAAVGSRNRPGFDAGSS